MNNQEKIELICKQERKIVAIKEWLTVVFVLACFASPLLIVHSIFTQANEEAPKNIVYVLIIFATSLFLGFAYNNKLSKRLNRLWEEKKELI